MAKKYVFDAGAKNSEVNEVPGKYKSKFPHEQHAFEKIEAELGNHVELISNYDLHDGQTNQYLECDLILIGTHGLAVVELKHWYGEITVSGSRWFKNGRDEIDPHRHNNYKCKVLKGFCRKTFPFFSSSIYIESIVVLTNPDATVHNASRYDTNKNNPTFDKISTFSKYIKRSIHLKESKLSQSQVKSIADKLRGISEGPKYKGLNIPGYKELVNLTESPHRVEILVQPIGNQLETVKRLRIFSVDSKLGAEEREKQRVKARNSLKALTHISDHSNILKVWDIYHEDGLVIEASDWSKDEGTLEDVIENADRLDRGRALKIIRGIAEGLQAVHDELIIHRDLRPCNIMMFGDTPKLMNFDLSYLPEDERLTVLPEDLEIEDSPYLAPELYLRKPFSEATDLFSLGVIAFELLSGKPPFERRSIEILHMGGRLDEKSRSLMASADIPKPLQELLDALIREKLEDRIDSADDVLELLDGFAVEKPEAHSRPEPNRLLQPEDFFSRYRIESLIDVGREAQVYRARKGENDLLALKLFHQEFMPDQVERIEKIIRSIDSPYVIKCETSFQWEDGRSFLHLELIEGQSLRQQIKENQQPDLQTFAAIGRCLMDAVKAMHHHPDGPFLHNDIKSDNVHLRKMDEPVLLDFGIAGRPGIGIYKGTDAYVAPDLFQEADYDFCVSSDLFSLGITLFEWLCGEKPYRGTPNINSKPESLSVYMDDAPPKLIQWFAKAVAPFRDNRFIDIDEMRSGFDAALEPPVEQRTQAPLASPVILDEVETAGETSTGTGAGENAENPFVAYLNTLHNTSATNEGALAETQALSPFFGTIHVESPLTEIIFDHLTKADGGHVILTGHAGDGKSTVALEVFKRLKEIPMTKPIKKYRDHEKVPFNGFDIHIVKDMSENTREERNIFIQNAADSEGHERWLIISNTGTLLKTFADRAEDQVQELEIENEILGKLQIKDPVSLTAFGTEFFLINLTQMDNVPMAARFFQKLIHNEEWKSCKACEIREHCPIWINWNTLQAASSTTVHRVELVYRMLHEYGKRLTMRQISAHLAYSITSGFNCDVILQMAEYGDVRINEHLFYNRFFGFKGAFPADSAGRLKPVEVLRPYEFGAIPFPELDRSLWKIDPSPPPDVPDMLDEISESLVEQADRTEGAFSARLRQELRRLYYMFGAFPRSEYERKYITIFTGSPLLVEYDLWQKNPPQLNHSRKSDLLNKVLRVLQEQFVGFHLPDSIENNQLFITLNRRDPALRQSVQLLLARIPFFNFQIEMKERNGPKKMKGRSLLVLQDRSMPEPLYLELPFLDYVMMRSSGEIGQQINRAYLDRLERFKARLMDHYKSGSSAGEKLDLLEFTNDGNFKIKELIFDAEKLHVMGV
jgi:serine/threonine protein kinase